jgi:hypothetical protein
VLYGEQLFTSNYRSVTMSEFIDYIIDGVLIFGGLMLFYIFILLFTHCMDKMDGESDHE